MWWEVIIKWKIDVSDGSRWEPVKMYNYNSL